MGELIETPRMVVNSCPSLKILFHDSGHIAGTDTWRSHTGGLTWILSGTLSLKDSYGVYSSDDQSSSGVSGVMPTLHGYGVVFAVGRFASNSANTGLNTVFGSTDGLYQNAYCGSGGNSGSPQISDQGTVNGNLSIVGDVACVIGIVDYVSIANPFLFAVRANAHGEYDLAIGNMIAGTNLSLHTTAPLFSDIHQGAALLGSTREGARCKMFGLFDLPSRVEKSDLIESALFMSKNYGQMWPGFHGR